MGRTGFQPNSEETDTSLLPGAVEFASTWWPGAALSPGALELSRVPTAAVQAALAPHCLALG